MQSFTLGLIGFKTWNFKFFQIFVRIAKIFYFNIFIFYDFILFLLCYYVLAISINTELARLNSINIELMVILWLNFKFLLYFRCIIILNFYYNFFNIFLGQILYTT